MFSAKTIESPFMIFQILNLFFHCYQPIIKRWLEFLESLSHGLPSLSFLSFELFLLYQIYNNDKKILTKKNTRLIIVYQDSLKLSAINPHRNSIPVIRKNRPIDIFKYSRFFAS